MVPEPLHPALVHFPIVLALLAPLLAGGFFLAIQSKRLPARAWLAVVGLQLAIVATGWMTAETGEEEEERVERVVAEDPIEEHEEAAETFLWLAGITLPIAAAGLMPGGLGGAARGLALVASLAAAVAVARVGHTGGLLVYEHGAALAYLDGESGMKALGRSALDSILSGGRRDRERDANATDAAGTGSSPDGASDGSSRQRRRGGED